MPPPVSETDEELAELELVERYEAPAQAPRDSYWSRQTGVDFFLPPPVSQDRLEYLDPSISDLASALRDRFGLLERPSPSRD